MTTTLSIDQVFELAIAAEEAAERGYRDMASWFALYPEVTEFWKQYAREEAAHAQALWDLQRRLDAEQLAEPADAGALADAQQLFRVMSRQALDAVQTLDDAYELANELEHSEINTVFEFLFTTFSDYGKGQAFLRSQLRDHITRLMYHFPASFQSAAVRRGVAARK